MAKQDTTTSLNAVYLIFEEIRAELQKLNKSISVPVRTGTEIDLSSIDEKLKSLQVQLDSITSKKDDASLTSHLQDIKRKISQISQPSTGVSSIELQQELNSFAKKIESIIRSKTIQAEKKEKASLTIYIDNKYILIFIGILMLMLGLTMFLYDSEKTKRISLQENDLKYRYILMENGANKDDLRWLENVFMTNKNDTIVSKIRQAVELHEKSLKEEQDKE